MKNYLLFIAVLFLTLPACKQENKERTIELPGGKKAVFLNLAPAQQAIAKDEVEGYFDKVTKTDIEIQAKKIYPDSANRNKYIAEYRAYLKDDVEDFSSGDRDFLAKILKEIGRILNKIDPSILDRDINLIKVKGRHYGPSVFYTRENNIIIPGYELAKREESIMRSILIHEIFHIYSRYHPEKRQELYAMIGFTPLGIPNEQINMSEELRSSILLNPDGIDFSWVIQLNDQEGREYSCILITSSEFHQYSSAKVGFFPYLTTNFFPVVPDSSGTFTVVTSDIGTSPLDFQEIGDSLWKQIGKNTLYIIHPDEILADNFSLLALKYMDPESAQTMGAEERDMLHEMEQIIRGE